MKKNIPLTPEEKTEALKMIAAGESFRSIGVKLGRAPNSIRKVANDPKNLEQILAERERIAGKYQKLAERLVDGITDQQIGKAPLGTRVLASCQAIDKAELLRGRNKTNPVIQIHIRSTYEELCGNAPPSGEVIEIETQALPPATTYPVDGEER